MNASHLIIFHIFFLTIQVKNKPLFHRISSPHSLIKYYVVVIGSGYGTSIAASRKPQAAAHALVNQSAFWNEARSGYQVIFLRLSEKHQNMHKSILVAREEN